MNLPQCVLGVFFLRLLLGFDLFNSRFHAKGIAFGGEHASPVIVILDDAVVHEGEFAVAAPMWMSILDGRRPMRRPARVSHTNADAVVAAILEPAQTAHQQRHRFLAADIANDAAHKAFPVENGRTMQMEFS